MGLGDASAMRMAVRLLLSFAMKLKGDGSFEFGLK